MALRPELDFASDPALVLGIVGSVRGTYDSAERYGREALATAENDSNVWNLSISCYVLARAAYLQGRNEEGMALSTRAVEVARQVSDRWFMAYCLLELGNGARALGDYDAATAHYLESYNLRKEFSDGEGQGYALNHIGEVKLTQKAWQEALGSFAESVAIYRELRDPGGLASACRGFARASAATGDTEQSKRYFREALELAAGLPHLPLVLWTLIAVAEALMEEGQTGDALLIARAVRAHPRIAFETLQAADELLQGSADCAPPSLSDLEGRHRKGDRHGRRGRRSRRPGRVGH